MSHWLPQIIYLVLTFLGLMIVAANHGREYKADRQNAFPTFLGSALVLFLLYWGGFFEGLRWG